MDAVNDGFRQDGAAVAGGAQASPATAMGSAMGASGGEAAGAGMGAAGSAAVADGDAAATLASRFPALDQLDTMDDAARNALFSSIHADLQHDLDGIGQ